MICKAARNCCRTGTLPAISLALFVLMTTGSAAEAPCLLLVKISPEARVAAERGTVSAHLRQGVWQSFTVCFENEARVTAVPRIVSPNAPVGRSRDHWLDIRLDPPGKRLTGSHREYRTIHLRSRDAGPREATFLFDVGQGTQDLGFRGQVPVLFQCLPSTKSR
jgi:hypothetical protein